MLTKSRAYALSEKWQQIFGATANRRIFAAALTISGATAVVSIASIVRELIVAHRFGTSDALDAFIVAIALPTFVVNVVGGSFAAALVPIFIRVREREGLEPAQRVFSGALVLGGALLIGATALLALANSLLLPLMTSGFDAEKVVLTRNLFYLFLPVIFFGGMATMLSSILNAGDRFALPAISQILIPLAAILALVVGDAWGIYALLFGVVAGFALRLLLLAGALVRQGLNLRLKWHGMDPTIRQVIDQYLPMVAAAALMAGIALVDQAVAATLPPGSVATLGYGSKVVALVTGLGAVALGTAVLPHFSRMVAAADWQQVRQTMRMFTLLTLAATTALTLVLFFFSRPIVELVFQRGAFTESDALEVAQVQSLYALQLPFYGLGILYVRLLSSLGANRVLLGQAALCLPINAALDIALARVFGVAGIAVATSLMYIVAFCILGIMSRRLLKRAELNDSLSHEASSEVGAHKPLAG